MPCATNPVDGARIYCEVGGSGPPLVLLNGGSITMQRSRDRGYGVGLPNHPHVDRFRTTRWDGVQRG